MVICLGVEMSCWGVVGELSSYRDGESSGSGLGLMKMGVDGDGNGLRELGESMCLLVGKNGGCMGEVSGLGLLLGVVYMLWKKIMWWDIGVWIVGSVLVL